MARKTKVTMQPRDSGEAHSGEFNAAVSKIRSKGETSDSASVSPVGIKDWQVDPISKYDDVRPE